MASDKLVADLIQKISDFQIVVQDLASQVRADRKIIEATQTFTTRLADDLDLLEESLSGRIDKNENGLLAIASGISRMVRAQADEWSASRR